MNLLLIPVLLLLLVPNSYLIREQLWESGINPHSHRVQGGCVHLHDYDRTDESLPVFDHNLEDLEIPESFDARENWPNCPSIREISQQSNCGSCWAFGSVEAMTDRTCIHSEGKINFHFSADDVVSCCSSCGGCNGSFIHDAYNYWVSHGIVSGGPYGSHEGCRPYEIGPLYSPGIAKTPKCLKKCERGYKISYKDDLHFGKTYYKISNNVKQIQAEIMLRGPVTASFYVYDDFRYEYTGKGIYHHTHGDLAGAHAVKLIGWGIENGENYWIVANSWGTDFGDGGFFKFLRGEDDSRIEDNVWGGMPLDS